MNFLEAKIKEIRQETSDSYSFIMEIPEGLIWTAGQHAIWKHKEHKVAEGERDVRVFTVASAPEDGYLMFTTRITDRPSSFKDILLNKLEVGDIILVAEPRGNFTLEPEKYSHSVIIAGGIGITPIRSLLRHYMEAPEAGHGITVLYSDDRSEYAYKDFWAEVTGRVVDLDVVFISERDDFTSGADECANTYGNDAEYLIAGSPGMNTAFSERLQGKGISPDNIKTDIFMGY